MLKGKCGHTKQLKFTKRFCICFFFFIYTHHILIFIFTHFNKLLARNKEMSGGLRLVRSIV